MFRLLFFKKTESVAHSEKHILTQYLQAEIFHSKFLFFIEMMGEFHTENFSVIPYL